MARIPLRLHNAYTSSSMHSIHVHIVSIIHISRFDLYDLRNIVDLAIERLDNFESECINKH